MVASKPVSRSGADRIGNTVADLQRQVDELTRRSPTSTSTPVCRVQLGSNVPLTANTETYTLGWVVGEDPDGIATLPATFGASYMTVPLGGRYLVQSIGVYTAYASASTMTVWVSKNAQDSSASVALKNENSVTNGGASIITATRPVLLSAGDRLYWGHWSFIAATLTTSVLGIPTEVSITYLGAR